METICTVEMGMDENIIPDICICLFEKKFHFDVASVRLRCSIASGALRNLADGRMELFWKVMD